MTYGDGRSEIVSTEELSKLVTEQGNPGNEKNVVRAMVEVPSPRLRQGIVLVDTPGSAPWQNAAGQKLSRISRPAILHCY